RALNRSPAPRRILVQYVPHAFGWKGANLPFCLWLRLRRHDSIWVMFHEVMFLAEGDPRVSRLALAAVNRWMAMLVAGAAERALENLAVVSDCHVLLLGDRSDAICRALTSAHPSLAGRLFATGRLTAGDVSRHVAACDLMLQPYPDGISSRRTSAMVALAHGRAIVT